MKVFFRAGHAVIPTLGRKSQEVRNSRLSFGGGPVLVVITKGQRKELPKLYHAQLSLQNVSLGTVELVQGVSVIL